MLEQIRRDGRLSLYVGKVRMVSARIATYLYPKQEVFMQRNIVHQLPE